MLKMMRKNGQFFRARHMPFSQPLVRTAGTSLSLTAPPHRVDIDFGHFLGNFKSKYGLARETAPFVFTPAQARVLVSRVESSRTAVGTMLVTDDRSELPTLDRF